ncbi:hypothetical protein SAMN02745857_02780 [Andreprevotia lacus DSM 23236]|jgi:hypothetical protein|uniref:Imelysin n=1 Tax=Andreprevotia lacus DSM 23236 TaxID=1121001 RepID=A0A1W1XTI3_9NEIS|nr:hypothetical protein [Andreprevotia lacus]SMC27273.1 hypothetical protein SAMN02745857_02780 [Andreprevotia lacus DSM 23236]
MLRLLLASLAALLISGCATNLSAVSTFGNSTEALATQSGEMLQHYAAFCDEVVGHVEQENRILQLTRLYWAAQPASTAKTDALRTLDEADEAFSPHADTAAGRQQCEQDRVRLARAQVFAQALQHYASALGAVASDQFVTYNARFDDLGNHLRGTPLLAGETPAQINAQVEAVQGLTRLVYDMAVRHYRQTQLASALGDEQEQRIALLLGQLQAITQSYQQSLTTAALQTRITASFNRRLLHLGTLPEPLAVAEQTRALEVRQKDLEQRAAALGKLLAALEQLPPAFTQARDAVQHPDRKDIAKEVLDFGKAVYKLQRQIGDAF